MAIFKKLLALSAAICMVLCMAACNEPDEDYGVSKNDETVESTENTSVEIPEIKSDDEVMPTFFDISLFDEENYSDIYLGKDFEYKITYGGSVFKLPSSYKAMEKAGWTLMQSEEYNAESQIFAGKSMTVQFTNQYNNVITAVFYNKKDASVSLKKCPIVKLIVEENVIDNMDSPFTHFFVNGITNESAITDIIQYLGTPSHFYSVDGNVYYLDYFITEKDKRNGITVYINVGNDSIERIEVSMY